MELDDLKKAWTALDKQLQKTPVTDKKQLAELITAHKANMHKSLNSIYSVQRTSVIIGIIVVLLMLGAAFEVNSGIKDEQIRVKALFFIIFMTVTVISGLWWDIKSYRWGKSIHVDEMPVVEVSRRITVFKRWTKYEMIAICIWAVLFNILYYWLMDFYHAPALMQVLIIASFILCDILIIYLLYKKFLFRHLNNIDKNIEELKDICTE